MSTKKKIAWIAGVVALGALGFVALRIVDFPIVATQLSEAIKEAKAVGIPLTSAELTATAGPSKPTTDLSVYNVSDLDPSLPLKLYTANPDWVKTAQLVSLRKTDLDALRNIAQQGASFPPRDWDVGPDLLLPEYAQAKEAAKALSVAAVLESHQGRFNEAARDLVAARAFGEPAGRDFTLIGMLVEVAIDGIVFRATEFCLADAAESPASIEALKAVFDRNRAYDLRRALRGEAFMSVTTARNFDLFGGSSGLSALASGGWRMPVNPALLRRSGEPPSFVARAYLARSLQYWTKVFRYMDGHPDDLIGLKDYENELYDKEQGLWNGMSREFNNIMIPVLSQAILASIKDPADQRCKLALAMALQFRCAHGRFPTSLAEVGVHLDDPFDGKPLRYRATRGTVRVWSVGVNMKDDGGVSMVESPGHGMRDTDIVASYPPIKSKS